MSLLLAEKQNKERESMSEQWKDYYKTLRIDKNATEGEIKKAYRSLIQQYHPDKNMDLNPEELKRLEQKTKEIIEAYSVLKNEKTRTSYNIEYDIHHPEEDPMFFVKQANAKYEETKRQQAQEQEAKARAKKATKTQKVWQRMQEARKEERKKERQQSFWTRHEIYNRNISKEYPDISKIKKGTFHIAMELVYTLSKLSYQDQDNIYRYTARNRKTIAAVVVGGILISSGIFQNTISTDASYQEVSPTSETTTEYAYESPNVTLTRIYQIKAGDTLSELAEDANCTINDIKSKNDIKSNMIRMGDTIEIPYSIPKEELYLYTEPKPYDNTINLSEYAYQYNTTATSLLKINEEAIIQTENSYCVISDSLMVPTFKPYQNLKSQEKVKK